MFGVYTNGAALALLVVDSVFSAAIAPAVYEIAARCFDAQGIARRASKYAAPVALWSAWMWAVYPAALQYAVHWIWEMSLSTCLFTWALVLALRLRGVGEDAGRRKQEGRKQGWGLWLVLGVLWGLIALSNASLLFVCRRCWSGLCGRSCGGWRLGRGARGGGGAGVRGVCGGDGAVGGAQ